MSAGTLCSARCLPTRSEPEVYRPTTPAATLLVSDSRLSLLLPSVGALLAERLRSAAPPAVRLKPRSSAEGGVGCYAWFGSMVAPRAEPRV